MNFTNIEQVKFELVEATTWGVDKNIYGGYSIPVSIDDDEVRFKIRDLVKKYNAKDPIYGFSNTLYLKSKNLSEKQKEDLFGKGRLIVNVKFTTKCLYTRDGVNYIIFQVLKLNKVDTPPPEDWCSED